MLRWKVSQEHVTSGERVDHDEPVILICGCERMLGEYMYAVMDVVVFELQRGPDRIDFYLIGTWDDATR